MPSSDDPDDVTRFTTLFRMHYMELGSFARRRVGSDAAQEILAETFLVAWRRIDDIPEPALPWLYKVAQFEISNYRRRADKYSRIEFRLATERVRQDQPVNPEGKDELDRTVSEAFSRLQPTDQEILRLAAWERLSSTDGAKVLGCSVSAYRVRLHRARVRLAKRVNFEEWAGTRLTGTTSKESNRHPYSSFASVHQIPEESEAVQ